MKGVKKNQLKKIESELKEFFETKEAKDLIEEYFNRLKYDGAG